MRDHTMGTMIRLGGILSVDEKMIADARLMSEETAASWGLKTLKGFGEWEANVIRIVACWNACNGLPTEKLEQHNIGYVIGEAERERGQAEPFLLEQIRKLEEENKALREDAERWRYGVIHGFPRKAEFSSTSQQLQRWNYPFLGLNFAFDSADAAIDAARGEK
jgi:hypothetical protein